MFERTTTFVLKVTKGCNLRCKYCYIEDKDTISIMSDQIFQDTIERIISDKLSVGNFSEINLILHGGEPTTLGVAQLTRYLQYAKVRLNQAKIPYIFGIQSNLTLVDKDMLEVFQKYGIHSIGASYDGGDGASDYRSTDLNDSFLKEKIDLAAQYGVKIGVLTVVSRQNYKTVAESYSKLEAIGIKSVRTNYVENVINDDKIEVTGQELFDNVIEPELNFYLKNKYFRNENLASLLHDFMKYFLFDQPDIQYEGNCYTRFCGSGMSVINIEPDGSLMPCGRYSKTFPERKIGHVNEKDFLGLNQLNTFLQFTHAKGEHMRKLKCSECIAYPICDGGCMAFHYSKFKDWGLRTDIICDYFIGIWKFFSAHITEICRIYLDNFTFTMPQGTTLVQSPVTVKLAKEIDISFDRERISFKRKKDV